MIVGSVPGEGQLEQLSNVQEVIISGKKEERKKKKERDGRRRER